MAGNINPIFSRVPHIHGGVTLSAASIEFTGQNVNNKCVFTADEDNGSFIQKLRYKSLGTNGTTVSRIWINSGELQFATTLSAVAGTPTGTPSASGGTLASGNYYAKIQAYDQYDGMTVLSTETAAVAVTGPTGSITWNWTAVTGATKYRIWVGSATNSQLTYFEATTNSYVQTAPEGTNRDPADYLNNNMYYGEVSLPATTASNTAATAEVDYNLNIGLPPGYCILVGLANTVSPGWVVTAIGGKY